MLSTQVRSGGFPNRRLSCKTHSQLLQGAVKCSEVFQLQRFDISMKYSASSATCRKRCGTLPVWAWPPLR